MKISTTDALRKIMYADDRAILGECWKQRHGALEDWKELFKKHGLKTNLYKTEVM